MAKRYYIVFEGLTDRAPGSSQGYDNAGRPMGGSHADYVPFRAVTVTEAEDAQDAVEQVVAVTRRLGSFVAVECEPVNIDLKPRRLLPEG